MIPGIPGGELAARPLHFFWIADCSGSMAGEKIQQLNFAIREAIPAMRQAADSNPYAQVFMRAIKFSTGAQWHISQPTPLEHFQWVDLSAGGVTDMGKAFLLVAEQLKMPPMPPQSLPPVLILVSDGGPTDDVNRGLKAIMAEQWGQKSVRLAIGYKVDGRLDILQRFIGNPEIQPCYADNSDELTKYIKWASTMAIQASSAPYTQDISNQQGPNATAPQVNIPAPPPVTGGQAQNIW